MCVAQHSIGGMCVCHGCTLPCRSFVMQTFANLTFQTDGFHNALLECVANSIRALHSAPHKRLRVDVTHKRENTFEFRGLYGQTCQISQAVSGCWVVPHETSHR